MTLTKKNRFNFKFKSINLKNIIDIMEDKVFFISMIECMIKRGKMLIVGCYRSPITINESSFVNKLNHIFGVLSSLCKYIMVIGDFNIYSISRNDITTLKNILTAHALYYILDCPTRINQQISICC